MTTAIRIEGLGKRYLLGETHARSIRDVVDRWTRKIRPGSDVPANRATTKEEFWALRELSLDVMEGQAVAIIGRNGAGKSTLLKLLSRITKPTVGRAVIQGRVGSLLEVGTGFHPELTGRENVFLNGAILGMTRKEISRKFDEIVDFAEIEKFLDTPVKRYSSGMYVRLAFAVAAHLEPEVLIVDEVLAVGDSAFQAKCLGKMKSVGQSGRTVLFVSHNMGAVKQLCDRAVLLEHGEMTADGPAGEVVHRYLHSAGPTLDGQIAANHSRFGTGEARVNRIQLLGLDDQPTQSLYLGQPVRMRIEFEQLLRVADAHFELNVLTADGVTVAVTHRDLDQQGVTLLPGRHIVEAEVDLNLLPGHYLIGVAIYRDSGPMMDGVENALSVEVLRVGAEGVRPYRWQNVRGLVRPPSRWTIRDDNSKSSLPLAAQAD